MRSLGLLIGLFSARLGLSADSGCDVCKHRAEVGEADEDTAVMLQVTARKRKAKEHEPVCVTDTMHKSASATPPNVAASGENCQHSKRAVVYTSIVWRGFASWRPLVDVLTSLGACVDFAEYTGTQPGWSLSQMEEGKKRPRYFYWVFNDESEVNTDNLNFLEGLADKGTTVSFFGNYMQAYQQAIEFFFDVSLTGFALVNLATCDPAVDLIDSGEQNHPLTDGVPGLSTTFWIKVLPNTVPVGATMLYSDLNLGPISFYRSRRGKIIADGHGILLTELCGGSLDEHTARFVTNVWNDPSNFVEE